MASWHVTAAAGDDSADDPARQQVARVYYAPGDEGLPTAGELGSVQEDIAEHNLHASAE